MYWNYRIVKRVVGGDTIHGIHEVFYNDKNEVTGFSRQPDAMFSTEGVAGLTRVLANVCQALNRSVLDYNMKMGAWEEDTSEENMSERHDASESTTALLDRSKLEFPSPDLKFPAQFDAWKKLCTVAPDAAKSKEFGDFAVAHTKELMMMAIVGGKR